MIIVTKIVGESFDLQTGGEIPSAIVLSNGTDEVHVPVEEDVLKQVVRLFAGSSRMAAPMPLRQPEPQDPVPLATIEGDDEEPSQPSWDEEPGAEYEDPATGTESI